MRLQKTGINNLNHLLIMNDTIEDIILKILNINFPNYVIKTTYLYNEFFISVYSRDDFILFWISNKSSKIQVNKYKWDNTIIWKILLVLLSKYNKIFLSYLKNKQEKLFNLWDESEFINIYDKKDLDFKSIKEKLYFSFLDDYSYRRKNEMDFKIEEKSILDIYHSDFECSICCWPKDSFNNFPSYHNDIFDEKYFWSNKLYERLQLKTNITDYESITNWWNEKINEILQDKDLLEKYDLIALNKTCISVIMWDDITSVFKYNNIPEEKIFYTDQNTDSAYRVVINFLKNINVKILNSNKNNKIVFFWLNKNKNTFELIELLKNNFNIIVDKVLIPNINTEDLESIMNYNFWVFFTWREIKAQNIFKLYPLKQFESSVPYWTTKLKELLKQIFINMLVESYTLILEDVLDKYKNKYIDLYKKSKNYQIWFIIHDFHIKYFLKDNFRWVPIISMLNDMWFHLNFFIYSKNDKYKKDIFELNTKNDSDKIHNFDILVSSSKKDLEQFITNEDINCYYSEISNDKRILDKNKIQFSVWDFEYWLDWFYRTFELLIKKCQKQEYGKFKLWYYLK